jgi:hypothetical protein
MIPLLARGFNQPAERGRLGPGRREWLDLFRGQGTLRDYDRVGERESPSVCGEGLCHRLCHSLK